MTERVVIAQSTKTLDITWGKTELYWAGSDLHKNRIEGEADTPDSWSIPIRRNQPRRTESDGNLVFEENQSTVVLGYALMFAFKVATEFRIWPSEADDVLNSSLGRWRHYYYYRRWLRSFPVRHDHSHYTHWM